jgi:hypothetical protein
LGLRLNQVTGAQGPQENCDSNLNQLPINLYGLWNISLLNKGDLAHKLEEHLLSIGKNVSAKDVQDYLNQPEVQEKYNIVKTVSISTATDWMATMEFWYAEKKKGQYEDGHEQQDVVTYRRMVFLPAIENLLPNLRKFKQNNELVEELDNCPPERRSERRVVLWYHNESTFYAHNRRKKLWQHPRTRPDLEQKGNGPSIMVANFVSANYGFLASKDGSESTCVLFKAGKGWEGYFTNNNVVEHVESAMDILDCDYPDEHHIFVFDNATTHVKRPDDTLRACKMTKGPSAKFGCERPRRYPNG